MESGIACCLITSLASPPILVPVHPALIGAMTLRHAARRVLAQLGAVPVRTAWPLPFGLRTRIPPGAWRNHHHLEGLARRQHRIQRPGFPAVNGQRVSLADFDDAVGEPAPVLLRKPFGGIHGHLPVAVELRTGQRQVAEIPGESLPFHRAGAAQSAVVGLEARHDVFDVRFILVGEPFARVRGVHPAQLGDDSVLDGLRVGVVAGIVRGAPGFFGDVQAAPGFLGMCWIPSQNKRQKPRRKGCELAGSLSHRDPYFPAHSERVHVAFQGSSIAVNTP